MKRIAIVIPSLAIGGCERGACNISFALKDKYEVYMVVFDSSDAHYDFNGTLIDLNLPAHPNPVKKIYNTLARAIKFKKAVKKYKFDYIYSFLGGAHLINYLKYGKTKKFVSCIGFGYLKKYISTYKKMTEKSDGIIFNSYYMQNYFDNLYPQLKYKTHTVQNVFDIDDIINSSKEQTEKEFDYFVNSHKTIVSTGRFCREKGFDNLIKAFSLVKEKNKDAGLVLIGGGELEDKLKKLSSDLNLSDSIYFAGYTDNPYKYMAQCDIYTLSSRNEGFPNVLMEAMILGLPVIATNCESGPYEILFDKFLADNKIDQRTFADYGIIIPDIKNEENYSADNISDAHNLYADAISELLYSEELKAKYSALSLIRRSEFTKEIMAEKYVDIFEL